MEGDMFTDDDMEFIRNERTRVEPESPRDRALRLGKEAQARREGRANPQAGAPRPPAQTPSPYGIIDDRDGTREKAVGYWARAEAAERQRRNRIAGLPYDTIIRYEQAHTPKEQAQIDKGRERHERALKILRDAGELFQDTFTQRDVEAQQAWSREHGLRGDEIISKDQYFKELSARMESEGAPPGQLESVRNVLGRVLADIAKAGR